MHFELPIGCFVAAFLVLIPFPWHWQARNVPTLSLMTWLFVVNLIDGVNSLLWAGSAAIKVPVWCDIVTKVQMGATFALPVSCLCLCVHLERISSTRQAQSTPNQKNRRMISDVFLCWIAPMVYMALHYVVQGHRFDIVEDFGCRASIYDSVQSILLLWLPPLFVAVCTIIYACSALHHFLQHRLAFARLLQDNHSALTPSRYFRLMSMVIVQIIWLSFVLSINVAFNSRHGLRPWISWSNVHSNFSRIGQFPTMLIPPSDLRWTYLLWWSLRISAFLFFIFFAFGQDAIREYSRYLGFMVDIFSKPSSCLRSQRSKRTLSSGLSMPYSGRLSSEPKFIIHPAPTTAISTEYDISVAGRKRDDSSISIENV
ncbi:hypothetical protein NP233_g5864 [Leucocoprinus birnbaumii]|uniref:Pheromone receptor n=1 Tax=Leucocoprinus birnbaumii TaxID=56174 RepID=A0AAD5VS31_9AGAR|nr:hypothetical protein NP233_g5864 [Leucocoprinus birnbaumii]